MYHDHQFRVKIMEKINDTTILCVPSPVLGLFIVNYQTLPLTIFKEKLPFYTKVVILR